MVSHSQRFRPVGHVRVPRHSGELSNVTRIREGQAAFRTMSMSIDVYGHTTPPVSVRSNSPNSVICVALFPAQRRNKSPSGTSSRWVTHYGHPPKQQFAVLMQTTERAQSRRSVDASDYRALHDRSTMDHAATPPTGSGPLAYARCAVYARTPAKPRPSQSIPPSRPSGTPATRTCTDPSLQVSPLSCPPPRPRRACTPTQAFRARPSNAQPFSICWPTSRRDSLPSWSSTRSTA